MSKNESKEPERAVDALLETDEFLDKVTIHPLTCARYALLSKTGSPFVTPGVSYDIENLIPSVYIFCSDIKDLKKYVGNPEVLKEDALEAADELTTDQLAKITDKIMEKFNLMSKVAPNASTEKKTESLPTTA